MAQNGGRHPTEAMRSGRGPRPEATALKWTELLDTTQEATAELIDWLCSAVQSSQARKQGAQDPEQQLHEQLATSVLVSGDRGFGKTTVLLSAAAAFQDYKTFLQGAGGEDARAASLEKLLQANHQRLIWLSPLDMEPLPADANLLATLLVRVRDALSLGGAGPGTDRMSSSILMEEGAEDAWGDIEPLVREATFMWEESTGKEQDSRQRAEDQLRSAEIYATFRGRFFKALDSVSRYLAHRIFGRGVPEDVILLLPIDNVDRSTQHLHLILKLTRMVASRKLWFVLAAGRQEFQLFLERTFQKELTESGKLLLGAKGREETMSIARRQAASVMRRVLPPVHRIDIKSLTPRQVWEFRAPASVTGEEDDRPLHVFLRKLVLPSDSSQSDALNHFCDLFDVRARLRSADGLLLEEYSEVLRDQGELLRTEGPGQEPKAQAEQPVFTHAARLALSVSARTALDLWQEARRACGQAAGTTSQRAPPMQAILIAHRMLLMAIDEGELPNWASEQLLHRILRRDSQGRIFLDLTGDPVRRLKLTTLSDALEWPDPGTLKTGVGAALRSELHLRHFKDVVLELHDLDRPERSVQMPAMVCGWFMLLHDLLMITEERQVLTRRVVPLDVTPELLVTKHEVRLAHHRVGELNFRWMLPKWDTFIDSFIFTMQWKALLHRIREPLKTGRKELEAPLFRLVLAAWVDCVCSVADRQRGQWSWEHLPAVPRLLEQGAPRSKAAAQNQALMKGFSRQLDAYERQVASRVDGFFNSSVNERIRYGRLRITRQWIESFLPLLVRPEFVPAEAVKPLSKALGVPPSLAPPKNGRGSTAQPKKSRRLTVASWNRNRMLLSERRYEGVREVLEGTDAYLRLAQSLNTATSEGAQACRQWLEDSCNQWFEAVRSLEP